MNQQSNQNNSNATLSAGLFKQSFSIPIKITVIYVVFGLLWIFFSDSLLLMLAPDPKLFAKIQTFKGWFYVLVTAGLLFHLTRHFLTQNDKTQENLVRAKEEADQANKAKSDFLANMSHELRTPLSGLLGMLELLKQTEIDNEQKLYVDTALTTGHGLTALIGDILDLSKIEAGFADIDPGPLDFRGLVRFVLQNFKAVAADKGVELRSEIGDDVPAWLEADETRIRQILFNLLGNAVKFTDQGAITVRLTPAPSRDGSYLLQVEDTGIGIPSDAVNRMAEPFMQSDSDLSRPRQGAGLGLAIVKRLTDLMGGELSIQSREGQGTVVSLRLPMPTAQEPQIHASTEQAAHLGNGQTYSILVVEDDPVNLFALEQMLSGLGHNVKPAESGKQALGYLAQHTFDAVIMDVQMPGMSGIEATRAIRDSGKPYANVPILALTAHALRGDREEYLTAGMDGYLSKPASVDDLKNALRSVVHRGR
jgi:signal transduction histidine kinase/ActR/RegA family two-component response regulator